MIPLLLAAAAAAQPPLPADPDLRCMAAYLLAASDDTATAESKSGIASLVMYYLGKLDARRLGEDLSGAVTQVVQAPGYAGQVKADIERCNAEATARGRYLETFGNEKAPPAKP